MSITSCTYKPLFTFQVLYKKRRVAEEAYMYILYDLKEDRED